MSKMEFTMSVICLRPIIFSVGILSKYQTFESLHLEIHRVEFIEGAQEWQEENYD